MATLLEFNKSQPPRHMPPRSVTQEELLEVRILARKAQDAVQRWKKCNDSIRDRIVAGAAVEPGPFSVELQVRIK